MAFNNNNQKFSAEELKMNESTKNHFPLSSKAFFFFFCSAEILNLHWTAWAALQLDHREWPS